MKTIAVVTLAVLAACAAPTGRDERAAAAAAATPAPVIVDAARARELVAAGVKVIDVRTPAEFERGHLPNAVNIPFDEVERRAGELGPPSEPVLLYCRSGRRSGIASETLRKLGFTEIYDLQAYDRWTASQAGSAGR